MDTLKTRFDNIKYDHFKAMLKGLSFEIKKIDVEETEIFKVIVTNTENNKTISYNNFHNSIMELMISNYLSEFVYQGMKNFKQFIHKQMWGGYDNCKNLKDLINKRCYYLFYSVVNDMADYINFSEEKPTFEDFCLNYGYEEDSRKAEKIYKDCLEMEKKVKSLNLTESQEDYLINKARIEEDEFKQDCLKLFNVTD